MEIEYVWQVEPFNENQQQIGSAFTLIVANVVSLKIVIISPLCLRKRCCNGEAVHSVGRGPCLFIDQTKKLNDGGILTLQM